MSNPEAILVMGHRNPDMDAIASAMGYAWLLAQLADGKTYIAGRTGTVNPQTQFALDTFHIEAPTLISDVRKRVGDIVEEMPSLHHTSTILDACQSVAQTHRSVPLLNDDDKPVGLISGAALFSVMGEALSSANIMALAKDFEMPAIKATDTATTTLNMGDYIRDVMTQILRSEQDDFIVVDDNGVYTGLCRKSKLLSPSKSKIILVDHNELGQAVLGLEEAEVVEVLDHHRLSSIPTATPIRFRIEPVGSCSTLVAERGIELGKAFPVGIAGLLLCGILSDTLIFRSPTATTRDKIVAIALAKMAKLVGTKSTDDQALEAITELGNKLLAAGAGLGSRPASEIVNADIKFYEVNGANLGIAQVEVGNLSELPHRLDEIRGALAELVESQKLKLALLMVTDVVRGNSRLVAQGQSRIISALPYPRLSDDTLDAPGLMSRKKQLLPTVFAAVSQTT
ncbi:MAG: DHH family phosphoesterase [Anaerolineae bacterium]|jgi:manganese-dependent inorganic pyrophosphatase|nr:DHH family phosphoesterase [Anaerolineae bacterium]